MTLVLAHVWTEKMTAISTLLLAVLAFYALGSLGHAKRARHAQLIVDLTRRWDELLYREQMILVLTPRRLQALVRLVYGGRPSKKARDEFLHLIQLPSLLETIGVLVEQDALDVEIVDQLWGETIVDLWDRWAPAVKELQERANDPLAFEYKSHERLKAARS